MSVRSSLRSIGRATAATLLVSLAACSSDPISATNGQTLTLDRMTTLGASIQGVSTPDTARQRTTIKDASSWMRFWASLNPDPMAGGGAPNVDFSRDMVIAAVMPLRPSSGYQIEIERVTEWPDHIEAAVVERVPSSDCVTLTVVTRPFDAVRVPRRDKPVQFVERTEQQRCGTTTTGDTVLAPFGRAVTARNTTITLTKVVSDSRCPINALCIWEGDAAITLHFAQGTQQSDVTLHTSPKLGATSVTIGGIEFRLAGVTPSLVAGQTPPAETAYTAILALK